MREYIYIYKFIEMIQEYELSLLGIIRKIANSEEFRNALKERCLSESSACFSFCFFSEDREVQLQFYNTIVRDIKDNGEKSPYYKDIFLALYENLIKNKEYQKGYNKTDNTVICSIIKHFILIDVENICGVIF